MCFPRLSESHPEHTSKLKDIDKIYQVQGILILSFTSCYNGQELGSALPLEICIRVMCTDFTKSCVKNSLIYFHKTTLLIWRVIAVQSERRICGPSFSGETQFPLWAATVI